MKKLTTKGIKCPNCGSMATVSEHKLSHNGARLAGTGAIFSITIIGAVIGVPMIFIGLGMMIAGLFTGKEYKNKCKSCKYQWTTVGLLKNKRLY